MIAARFRCVRSFSPQLPRFASAALAGLGLADPTRASMTSWLEASEPGITSLQFADSFSDNPVKLFEMDDKVLEELLADGGRRLDLSRPVTKPTPRA